MPQFCDREAVRALIEGQNVAIVGSGPGVLENKPGYVDSHGVVIRVNNFKIRPATGARTDIFYSYFGNAIRKRRDELIHVKLCMCKCPDSQFIESPWHRANDKMIGVDFRWIYKKRRDWWFCPTYVPTTDEFLAHFNLLGGHVPTTGFAALLDVLSFNPQRVYLTGFDFFISGLHNVNERWRAGDPSDPIGHDPMGERDWLKAHLNEYPIDLDDAAMNALVGRTKYHAPPLPAPRLKRKRLGIPAHAIIP